MKCPKCGNSVPDNTQFCPTCGAKTNVGTQQSAPLGSVVNSPFTGKEYVIEQKIAAMRETFGVKDRNNNLLAYVKKKLVSWGPQFDFETLNGGKFGEMRGKVVAVRPTFEIYDDQGLVAVVKKKVLKLLRSEWWLENAKGTEIAKIKGNITAHEFSIQSPSGGPVALIHKKWVSIRDAYGIEIQNPEIDPFVIIAYVIAMDHTQFKADKGFSIGLNQ
ncbi:MAG TPA: LURP-one-related family protein [Candidatus Acidoferrales bacterium]|nr:LURP-one-related family protein [Candidatus Acidoferrales bacterium]